MDDLSPEQFCEGPVSATKGTDGEQVCYMKSDKTKQKKNPVKKVLDVLYHMTVDSLV